VVLRTVRHHNHGCPSSADLGLKRPRDAQPLPLQNTDVGPANCPVIAAMASFLGPDAASAWSLAERYLTKASSYAPVPSLPPAQRLPLWRRTFSFAREQLAQLLNMRSAKQLTDGEVPIALCHIFGNDELWKIPPRARVITDTFILNLYLRGSHPPTKLSSQLENRHSVFDGPRGLALDMKAWFAHFELSDEVSFLCCFKYAGAWYRWVRLPMGLFVACYVAQTALRILAAYTLAVLGESRRRTLAYIDNVKWSADGDTLLKIGCEFVRNAALANLCVGEFADLHLCPGNVDGMADVIERRIRDLVSPQVEFTGLRAHHEDKTVSLTDKVINKLRASEARRPHWTVKEAAAHFALLLYATYATGRPLWPHLRCMRALRACRRPLAEPARTRAQH
jgi:hypothetical protein